MSRATDIVYGYPPALMGVDEAARYLGISRSHMYEQAVQGSVPPPIKIGTRSLWRRSDLDRWVEEQQASNAA